MSKIFIDTNILAYNLDKSDRDKSEKCRNILKLFKSENVGVISTQVMQECYVTATKKLKIDPFKVKNILHSLENFEVVTISPTVINEAIDCSVISQISFWDSLIVCAAEQAKCEKLWTEDLTDGQVIRGIQIQNPILFV